ncbi:acyl-[acyl-carrier-protein] thioesterase [Petralouisia muris]|uniref:Acyl-[acyl-carrier-protein] thioesterase n=1 Tax=Petralouisia muris TaxID=3032872 RepID=A0AC61RWB2_9FIRM|nr:acyl-ACP thioesterase domain-containing protein [Petralouisia muris]TGY96012.1 acyl-[acyl-carrier-protein] thioesterase [Petralouisia muris]
MYSFDSRVRYSEVDSKGYIKMNSILDYFQDCSSFQAEEVEVGLDYMAEKHMAWVLTCWQVEFKRCPSFGEKITVSTWPYDFKGFFGYRNYTLKGEGEELLACANSVWVLLDLESGKPVRVLQEMADAYEFCPRLPMEHTSRKVALPKEMEAKEPFPVHKYHIDTNQHVNNGKYICMAQEYLPQGFQTGKMKAEYRKAAVYGDMIYPYARQEAGKITVSLADEQGSPYAVIELEERK